MSFPGCQSLAGLLPLISYSMSVGFFWLRGE
uniref:Uncharacterized protein n=1 Tax=Utricularia reniformis TaxID=192314 RepID=A0A1Y0B2Y6_9LAMI|nr:hypothetical protein AEK19_MT1586 [Utricularia reniformis]ART31770.1 hypothetical protein AEK19_MT1586 [Utricularia reniformis]